jgi:hypothetical protein
MTKRRQEAMRQEARFLKVVEGRFYRQIEGVWYEVELGRLPDDGRPAWDAVMRRLTNQIPHSERLQAYGRGRYAVRKRQLNSREVRRLLRALSQSRDGRR